jgi:hypothetical protein
MISIMKDFDWLQVHINNSFKNSSLKAVLKATIVRDLTILGRQRDGNGYQYNKSLKITENYNI